MAFERLPHSERLGFYQAAQSKHRRWPWMSNADKDAAAYDEFVDRITGREMVTPL